MLTRSIIILSILSLQVYGIAINNENNKPNQTDVTEEKHIKDSQLDPVVDSVINKMENIPQSQRQKRYGFYDFDDLPFNIKYPVYPSSIKRDDVEGTGSYGETNKLHVIQKRLQDLLTVTRRQYLPPRAATQPTFVPVFYVSPVRCLCDTVTKVSPSTPSNKPQQIPSQILSQTPTENPATNQPFSPDLSTRVSENEDDDDQGRPISFDPIPSNKPLNRKSPPVEHGTVQAGMEPSKTGSSNSNGILNTPGNAQFDNPVPAVVLSSCDKAILKCCHQDRTTYECFKVESCLEPPFKRALCETDVVSNVVNKFIKYFIETSK